MPQIPFVGPSYKLPGKSFADQRAINMYPVKAEKVSKSVAGFQNTPGLNGVMVFPEFPVRQGWNANGRVFWVVGNKLYESFVDNSYVLRGQLSTSTGNVSMSDNGQQVIMVDGPNGYVFNLTTSAFTNITTVDGWTGADTVTFIGGYFMFNRPDTGVYYISGLYDGTSIDPLDFATAEGSPDNLMCVKAVHNQVWLLGGDTVEVVYNQGGADFPFANIQGAFIQYGCSSAFSVATSANTIFWLGEDVDGGGVIWMANGYQPQRISTYAIEAYLQQYSVYLPQAVGYTYEEAGHYFYVLSIPNMPTTLVYDIGQDEWHERGSFSNGQYSRSKGQCHVYAYGRHMVGDYQLGIVYNQSLSYYDDDGAVIRRERISPYLVSPNLTYIYFERFQLDMQVGIGLGSVSPIDNGAFNMGFDSGFDIGNPDPANSIDPDTNPKVMLQWSDDGGDTWSNEYWVKAGMVGEYNARVLWRRLGRGRFRLWKVVITFRCPFFISAAYVDVKVGTN